MRQRVARGVTLVYTALLVGPVAPLVAGESWGLLAAGCAVGAVVGALATAGDAPAPDASWPLGVAGLVAPLCWLVPAAGESSVEAAVLSPWAVGASASVAWLLVVVAVAELRDAQHREAARTLVEFSARPPRKQRRQLRYATATLAGTAVLVAVSIAVLDSGVGFTTLLPLTILPTVLPALDDDDGRAVSVTDRGLLVEGSLHDWAQFEGYEHTDGTLVVAGSGLALTRKFDTDDIEDTDAVVDALDGYLPRLDDQRPDSRSGDGAGGQHRPAS
jgi:hypothetical protein